MGHLTNPLKRLQKSDHNNAIKTKIEDPLQDFLTTPSTPSKEFEMMCIYAMLVVFVLLTILWQVQSMV